MEKDWIHSPWDQEQDNDVHSHHFYSILYWSFLSGQIVLQKNFFKEGVQIGKEKVKLSFLADNTIPV